MTSGLRQWVHQVVLVLKEKSVKNSKLVAFVLDILTSGKRRLEERKKKHKKPRTEEDDDFPGREQIKFGDVVEAPPKLIAVPKAFKKIQDASQERLRLQAVDAYRKRKGWASRPGVQLPPPVTTSPFF
ncbi:UNVERIFIED_CONTAM: hypothetical protein Scaly_1800500 [Sesamum calycinum]|uniref:Uncharacterized protein n=1 Tax=Sesamum calycinum TaxID=2727403 RepID=A0AAW2NY30_9LAMI